MSGDPVEESSQVMRQGFVQALQTAHTTAALMRGRGGEARTKAEHHQRMNHATAKEQRSITEHQIRVIDSIESARQTQDLNSARVQEVRARIWRGGQLHELDTRHKIRQNARADADLARRNAAGKLEREQKTAIHQHQVDGYVSREARAVEVHDLEVEYKKLLIDIQRRAAGFSDSLTDLGDSGTAMASAAAFANAESAEGLSDQHQQAAAAYRARLAEDAGLDVDDFEALADLAAAWEQAGPWMGALDDVAGLIEQLGFATQLEHETGDVVVEAEVVDTGALDGSLTEAAVEAAGLTGVDYDAVIDVDIESDSVEIPLGPVTDVGVER
ncbi:hypothetical protein [Nocardia lijiangensis]|uniref:hypothetical protein n=1 Tax=Nocardia lijiangensis TaxID=299618 RepID=UPI000837A917|nr:hypothetical protein [Nocardia lijiangensis]